MALFAVVHPREGAPHFQLDRCHVNLFFLRNRVGLCKFFLDIGLLIAPTDHAEVEVQLALPFGTQDDSFRDLSDKILDQMVATQVFGERVVVNGQELSIGSYGDPFRVCSISPDHAKRLDKASDPQRSIWEIKVSGKPNIRTYVRMRFQVLIADCMWEWRPGPLVRDGALLDLRVADIRGIAAKHWSGLDGRIATIPYLNFFLVVPTDFRLGTSFPPAKYARLIEPSIWERYLDGKSPGRLTIYHWKHQATEKVPPISPDYPFRVYVELVPHSRTLSIKELLRLGTATIALAATVALILDAEPPWLTSALDSLQRAGTWAVALASAGIFAIIAKIRPVVGVLSSLYVFAKARGWKRWFQ